ncbi:ABC transporter ATP-binding protein [Vibrio mediterranei]|uniref:ABC transporter ATP-binding protein n=1 Tax=Vibrio mediterranei TaxID=689 RepID=UPI0040687F84
MSVEKVIELKNVGVTYKERKSLFVFEEYSALKDVSFDVYKGEVLGVIGRNGAGKSTLLRLLAGIIKPNKGNITHHTNSVSLMALAAGFDLNLSGRQNVIISGMLIGYSKKHIQSKLEEIRAFSELNEFFEKPVKTYSSGMRARLAFSIAMYVSPDVLLIDEVLGVGDASFKQKAEQALEEKIASDITVIIVSHSEPQVKRLVDRVVWIENGVVFKEGDTEEVFQEYNTNLYFSTFGLSLQSYNLSKDFVFNFEALRYVNGHLNFNCILIDLTDQSTGEVKVISEEGIVLSTMSSPKETPLYRDLYPNVKSAASARYFNGSILIEEKNHIHIVKDDTKVVSLKFYKGKNDI